MDKDIYNLFRYDSDSCVFKAWDKLRDRLQITPSGEVKYMMASLKKDVNSMDYLEMMEFDRNVLFKFDAEYTTLNDSKYKERMKEYRAFSYNICHLYKMIEKEWDTSYIFVGRDKTTANNFIKQVIEMSIYIAMNTETYNITSVFRAVIISIVAYYNVKNMICSPYVHSVYGFQFMRNTISFNEDFDYLLDKEDMDNINQGLLRFKGTLKVNNVTINHMYNKIITRRNLKKSAEDWLSEYKIVINKK